VGRYIKKFSRVGAVGPTEERGFAVWAGYDVEGVDDDLSAIGLIRVDDWSEEQLAAHGVETFTTVTPEDEDMYAKLGIPRHR
jgi:hypothetical protein